MKPLGSALILGALVLGGAKARSDTLPAPAAPAPAAVCGVNNCVFSHTRPVPESGAITPTRLGPPTTVTYTAFNGVQYVMKEYIGKNTSVLIKPADLPAFTEAQTWELVDQADYLYETFKELMGVEPEGTGPLRIAFVDNCGAGCGFVGYKGVELQPYFATGGVWFARGDLPDLYPYLAHEMTHNFDRWSSYVMFGPDTAHSWTAFMDVYIVCANQQGHAPNSGGGHGYSPADLLKKRVDEFFGPFLATPGATWQNSVRDATNPDLNSGGIQGGFAARLAQLLGPTATRRAMAELRKAATTRGLDPSTMTPEQKNDLLLECFSRGAQTNLTCLTPPLHWTISTALQSQLLGLYGPNNSACLDADGDGYTPLQGDWNDALSSMHPGATEILNGVDDDCDGTIDDLLFNETTDFPNTIGSARTVSFPFRITGAIGSSSDEDYFKLLLTTPTKVRFSLKSDGTFAGWLFLYDANGNWLTYTHCGANSQSDLDVLLPQGPCRFSASPNVDSTPGPYQLTAAPAPDWPTYTYPEKPSQLSSSFWRFVSAPLPAPLAGASDVQARFWVSGFGWIRTNALGGSNTTTFIWVAPSNLPPAETTCRVQFYQAANAAARATEALPLTGLVQVTPALVSNRNFSLSWSAASPGISVSSAEDVAGPWKAVTNSPSFTNGLFNLTLPRGSEPVKFFRLQGN